jgi:hypothetical protein
MLASGGMGRYFRGAAAAWRDTRLVVGRTHEGPKALTDEVGIYTVDHRSRE